MYRIAIIGAGNLTWHLAPALQRCGHQVAVFTRRPVDQTEWPVDIMDVETLGVYSPQLVFLAVPDGQINSVSKALIEDLPHSTVVIHSSGATAMKKIDETFVNRGVMWPIRSLSKGGKAASWRKLPIAYQASNTATLGLLKEIVDELTFTSYILDSSQRARLHLAAVFSNNFVSWMYEIAHELVTEKDIPFKVLLPIIRDTAQRQTAAPPKERQTGAAARGDQATMAKHLKSLNGHPEWSRLYRLMSRLIQEGLDD